MKSTNDTKIKLIVRLENSRVWDVRKRRASGFDAVLQNIAMLSETGLFGEGY